MLYPGARSAPLLRAGMQQRTDQRGYAHEGTGNVTSNYSAVSGWCEHDMLGVKSEAAD